MLVDVFDWDVTNLEQDMVFHEAEPAFDSVRILEFGFLRCRRSECAGPVCISGTSAYGPDAAVTAAAMSTEFGRCKMEANALESDRKRKKAMKDCYSKRME